MSQEQDEAHEILDEVIVDCKFHILQFEALNHDCKNSGGRGNLVVNF